MTQNVVLYVKRLLKHSSIYGAGTLLYRAVAVILVPLYTRHLPMSDYGDLELLFITSSFLIMILQFGMGSAIFRSVILRNECQPQVIVSTGFFFLAFVNAIIIMLLCVFADLLSQAIFETPDKANLLRILFVSDFFLVLAVIPQAKIRIDEKSTLFTIVALLNFIIGIFTTVLFLVVFNWGVLGVILAQLITSVIFAAIYLFVIIKDLKFTFSFQELKDMLGYGLPLVPASVATSVLMLSNRYFLKHLGSSEEVAIFSAGYRISQIVALLVNAFQMAWPTLLFTIVKEESAPETFSKLTNYFIFVMLTISLAFSIFARELILVATKAVYLDAQYIIPILVLSNVFWGIFYITGVGLQVKKKTIYVAVVIGAGAIVNLVLNYWLIAIPDFHLFGAALASFTGDLVVAVATILISLHYYYIKYDYSKIIFLFLATFLVYGISVFATFENFHLTVIIKIFLMGIYFVLVYVLGFFSKSEIEKLKQAYKMLTAVFGRTKSAVSGGQS